MPRRKDRKKSRKKKKRRQARTRRESLKVLTICPTGDLAWAESQLSRALADAGHEVVKHPCTCSLGFKTYEGTAQVVLDAVELLSDSFGLWRDEGLFDAAIACGWRSATTARSLKVALGCPFILVLDGAERQRGGPDPDGARRYVTEIEAWACSEADLIVAAGARAKNEIVEAYPAARSKIDVLGENAARLIALLRKTGPRVRLPTAEPWGRTSLPRRRGCPRIVVDMPWDASAHMGTGAYSEAMVRALAGAAPKAEIILAVEKKPDSPIELPNVYYMTVTAPQDVPEGWRQAALPEVLRRIEADVLFCPATLCPVDKICRTVVTVHDLTFRKYPDYYAPGVVAYVEKWFDQSLAAADHIVAISEETRWDLIELCSVPEDRITVIAQPVRDVFLETPSPGEVDRLLAELGVGRPFFFHVSNLAPHKNVAFAVEVLDEFLKRNPGSKHRFVVAGGANAPDRPTDFMAIARELGIDDRVQYVGRVSDRHLRALYHGCEALLFPSLVEGWGLPVAEAAACGARVLSTESPAAVRAEAQMLPLDPEGWARELDQHSAPCGQPDLPSARSSGLDLLLVLLDPERTQPAPLNGYTVGYRADWYSPSGFGEAARTSHRALQLVGMNPIPVLVRKDPIQLPGLWTRQTHNLRRADVWIHHLPPSHFDLCMSGKHVAWFVWEADRLGTHTGWIDALNRLDEIWVPATFLKRVLKESGVTARVEVIPHPIDVSKYSPGPRRPPLCALPPDFDATWTVFLFVGSWDPRKRPDILIRSFCKAFGRNDHALLIVKSHVTGDRRKDREIMEGWTARCKSGTAHISLVPAVLNDSEMVHLFRFATAFATASRGEGYCLPAAQAMSCGKPVVAHAWSAFADYVSVPVKFRLSNVPPDTGLPGFVPEQRWAEVDEEDLAAQLLWAHRNRAQTARLGREARDWVLANAAVEVIGPILKSRLLALSRRSAAAVVTSEEI